MRKSIGAMLIIFLCSGCGLFYRGDFTKDMIKADDLHYQQLVRWMNKKGVTETSLIGLPSLEVRQKLGKPSVVWLDKDRGACLDKIRKGLAVGEECSGEEWIYTNWYGIPYFSGFATYSIYFQKGVAVTSFGYRKDGSRMF